MAPSVSLRMTAMTWLLDMERSMRSLRSTVAKIVASCPLGESLENSSAKSVMKSDVDDFSRSMALSMAWLKTGSVLWPERALTTSETLTSRTRFIPPLRSRPKLISLPLHSMYVYFLSHRKL